MKDSKLTPTQYLIMEVLAARYRTGMETWTFDTRYRPQAIELASKKLVGWKSGIVQKTIRIWLTHEGKLAWGLNKPYWDGYWYDASKAPL